MAEPANKADNTDSPGRFNDFAASREDICVDGGVITDAGEEAIRNEIAALSRQPRPGFPAANTSENQAELTAVGKYVYMLGGCVCVGAGTVGILVPGLPTTIFMIIALWAFTKSSPAMRNWLYHHKVFGPPLQDWVKYRSIPVRARQIALGSLVISGLFIGQFLGGLACLAFILFVCAPVASFLWTLPESPKAPK